MTKTILLFLIAAMSLGAVAPAEGPTGIQFVVRVIEASSEPGAPNDASEVVPAELKEILRHTAYSQVGVAILRGRDAEFSLGNMVGEIDAEIVDRGGDQLIKFDLELAEKVPVIDDDGEAGYDWRPIIETADVARDGEDVVLGASSMSGSGKAMIVLMNVKIIR